MLKNYYQTLVKFNPNTSKNVGDKTVDLTESDYFFIENNEIVEKMIAEREEFKSKLINIILRLKEIAEPANLQLGSKFSSWVWEDFSLVHDFNFGGNWVSICMMISFSGWELQLFGRDESADNYIKQLLKHRVEQFCKNENRYVLGCWPLSVKIEEINETLSSWCSWMVEKNEKTLFAGEPFVKTDEPWTIRKKPKSPAEIEQEISELKRLISFNPNDDSLYFKLANLYDCKTNDQDSRIKILRDLIEIQPDNFQAFSELARCYAYKIDRCIQEMYRLSRNDYNRRMEIGVFCGFSLHNPMEAVSA